MASARDHQMVVSIDRARAVVAFEAELDKLIGQLGRRFLRRLFSGESFAQVAGCTAERRIAFVAGRFRSYLEELAEAGFC